ncbi:MAG: DUF4832 domain-containing protein, partial [Treponema sp.]|nr:DUF4832 domain-containing protein [Treponema sp.]
IINPFTATTVLPNPIAIDSGTVVNNPGKGWIPYVSAGSESLITDRNAGLYQDVLDLGTTGYTRFDWKDVQPDTAQPGADWKNFNWTRIDTAKNAWKSVGKKFAFRIMAANTFGGQGDAGKYITPKWVFENNPWGNAKYYVINFTDNSNGNPGDKVIPIWNDPGFIAAVDNLAKALAAKYGNDPDIDFIDIGTYGNWGEGHLYPIEDPAGVGKELNRAELTAHLKLYADAFAAVNASVPLVVDFGVINYQPVYDYAIANWGMGFRRDGVVGWEPKGICTDPVTGNGVCLGMELSAAYGKTPAIIESYATWDQYVQWNNTPGDYSYGLWTEQRFWDSLYASRASYQSAQWDLTANHMYDAQAALMTKAANLLGFHFILTKAVVPDEMKAGSAYWIEMAWQNHGLAPIYAPAKLAFALLTDSNNVAALVEAGDSDVSSWTPGKTVYENAKIVIPAGTASGVYRLAIGLFGAKVTGNPVYNIAIEGRLDNAFRWYPLCAVTVTNQAARMAAPAVKAAEIFDPALAADPVWPYKPVNPPDF